MNFGFVFVSFSTVVYAIFIHSYFDLLFLLKQNPTINFRLGFIQNDDVVYNKKWKKETSTSIQFSYEPTTKIGLNKTTK